MFSSAIAGAAELGVGVDDYINDNSDDELELQIITKLGYDGMTVNSLKTARGANNQITIYVDASY